MDKILALKVDVDTLKGYLEGVPRLLKIFDDRDISATFLFSFGPDNSGKAIKRIFRPGFLSKMFKTNAPSTYGLKTLLYGTLLPAPMIVEPNPAPFVRALELNHDCGVHAWDHVKWQDELEKLPAETLREDYLKAIEVFKKYAGGKLPKCCGAPGWQVSERSLAMQDEFDLDYCSDTRGVAGDLPFYPRLNGKIFRTLQIPGTLPTMDENIEQDYLELLREGLNVHTIHAEMEGGAFAERFEKFIDECLDRDVIFKTLAEVAAEAKTDEKNEKNNIRTRDITLGTLPGRAGKVAVAA